MTAASIFAGYLLSLEDESFFAVYRNYLGTVRTPYNKHEMIQRLTDFFGRPGTAAAIRELLTRDDLTVLSAIHLLGSPSDDQLRRFLADEFEYATMQGLILNHKDRLLVIDGPRSGTVRINPVILPALEPLELGTTYLVEGRPLPDTTDGPGVQATFPWISPALVAAMYAFLRDHPDPFTRSGTLRRRVATELDAAFTAATGSGDTAGMLRVLLVVFETLGLVTRSESDATVTLRPESWLHFAALPDRWIRLLLLTGGLTGTVERAFAYAELLTAVIDGIPGDRGFTPGELVRLFQLSGSEPNLPVDRDTIERLARVGVFREIDDSPRPGTDEGQRRYALNPIVRSWLDTEATPGTIRVHANMEVSVPPGAPFGEALTVARLAQLRRYDTVATYTLTERSIADARREGIEGPTAILREVTGELPQNVRFLLDRWESRSRAVRLLQGLVVIAAEEERALLNGSSEFRQLLQEELAPGVFLLREEDADRVERLLGRMDLGSAPAVERSAVVDIDVPEYERYLARYRQPALPTAPLPRFPSRPAAEEPGNGGDESGRSDPGGATRIKRELSEHLSRQKLPEDVRQELALRIDRGLILFPEQIREEIVPQFGIEVRGLDYLGKIRMIEQAIANSDTLEVIMRSTAGAPRRILVRPREIVESGSDLMLRAMEEPEGGAVKIRIRRISLLRRLSGTLISRGRKR